MEPIGEKKPNQELTFIYSDINVYPMEKNIPRRVISS
jgi:hypothetical protein